MVHLDFWGNDPPFDLSAYIFKKKREETFLEDFVFRKISSQTQELQIEVSLALLGACISACDANIWWRAMCMADGFRPGDLRGLGCDQIGYS